MVFKKGILLLVVLMLFSISAYATVPNEESINILDFGANGYDSIEDTDAINNALKAAVKNNIKTVIVPKGEYIVSKTIDLPSNINLKGEENSVIKLIDNANANTILLRLKGGENNIIFGLTFDGNVENLIKTDTPFRSEALINQSNTSKKTTNVRIENCIIKNTYSRGIRLVKAHDVVIENNSFISVGFDNLSILGESKGIKIANNNFENGKSVAIKSYGGVSQISVTKNTINNFTHAVGDSKNNWSIGIEFTNNISDITCTDNIVKNIGDIGISISKVNKGLCKSNDITNIVNGQNNGLGLEIVQSNNITAIENSITNSSIKNAIIGRSTNVLYKNNYSELKEDVKGNKNIQHIEISSKQNMVTKDCEISNNIFKGGTRGILGGKAMGIDITDNLFYNNFVAIDYGYYGGGENIRIAGNDFEKNKELLRTKNMINLSYDIKK